MPCVPVCAPLAEPRNAGYPGRPLGSQIAAQSLSAHSHEKAPPERGLSDVPASSDLAHVANAVLVHAVLAGAPGAGDHVSLSPGLEPGDGQGGDLLRSEEHTSELPSLMRISYAVFCLKKQNPYKKI